MTFGRPMIAEGETVHISADERVLVQLLQEDIPLVSRPFEVLAAKVGLTGDELIERIKQMRQEGKIRKVGAILRHQKAGYSQNSMITWQVPESELEDKGRIFSAFPFVTHCYVRPTMPGFPYNLYTMTHAKSREELQDFANQLQKASGIESFCMLMSEKEYKKASPVFFGGVQGTYPDLSESVEITQPRT